MTPFSYLEYPDRMSDSIRWIRRIIEVGGSKVILDPFFWICIILALHLVYVALSVEGMNQNSEDNLPRKLSTLKTHPVGCAQGNRIWIIGDNIRGTLSALKTHPVGCAQGTWFGIS